MKKSGEKQTGERDSVELLRLRAMARSLLQDSAGPPNIWVEFVDTETDQSEPQHAPQHATSGDLHYVRGENETVEHFRRRIARDFPVIGPPRLVILWPEAA